jgi:hypothetical protein
MDADSPADVRQKLKRLQAAIAKSSELLRRAEFERDRLVIRLLDMVPPASEDPQLLDRRVESR